MPEFAELGYFILASILLIIAPGPDILFLITQSIYHGPRAGLNTALGLASGNLLHTLAAALGASIIFQTSALAFTALKIAGACYLLYLTYEILRPSRNQEGNSSNDSLPGISLFLRGVLMNVLNPKVALFFLAFLPQFVAGDSTTVWKEMVFYGIVFTLLVVFIFATIGMFAGKLNLLFFKNQDSHSWFRWLTAAVFISLALHLFLSMQ